MSISDTWNKIRISYCLLMLCRAVHRAYMTASGSQGRMWTAHGPWKGSNPEALVVLSYQKTKKTFLVQPRVISITLPHGHRVENSQFCVFTLNFGVPVRIVIELQGLGQLSTTPVALAIPKAFGRSI